MREVRRYALFLFLPLVIGYAGSYAYGAAITALAEFYFSGNGAVTAATVDCLKQYPVIVVINDDAAIAIHVAGDGGTATTNSPKVKAGERYELPKPNTNDYVGRQTISVIAASGTPPFRVYGLP